MAHKIFDAKLKAAKREEQEIAARLALHKAELQRLLIKSDDRNRINRLQESIRNLAQQHQLAQERVIALEQLRPEIEKEEQQARKQLQAALPRLISLSDNAKTEYQALVVELEKLVERAEKLTVDYQAYVDLDYEARYLTALIGSKTKVPELYRYDPEPLNMLGQRLKIQAWTPSSPNASIKWASRFAELERQERLEAKERRREAERAKGLNPDGDVLTWV